MRLTYLVHQCACPLHHRPSQHLAPAPCTMASHAIVHHSTRPLPHGIKRTRTLLCTTGGTPKKGAKEVRAREEDTVEENSGPIVTCTAIDGHMHGGLHPRWRGLAHKSTRLERSTIPPPRPYKRPPGPWCLVLRVRARAPGGPPPCGRGVGPPPTLPGPPRGRQTSVSCDPGPAQPRSRPPGQGSVRLGLELGSGLG